MVRIQLLGPVRAWRGEHELAPGGPQQLAVLALLAVQAAAGRRVSQAELVDALWHGSPPASAENVVQTYLKHLRRLLEPDRPPGTPSQVLRRVVGGYTLDTAHVDIDLARFRRLLTAGLEAARAGDQELVVRRVGEAVRLWSGPPLANVTVLYGHPAVAALAGERWAVVARYGDALLATGRAADALPVLEEAAVANPLDESAQGRLIRAYHRLGRRGQAFAAFHATRRRLADELGIDPGPELAAAHASLLAEDRDRRATGSPAVVPAQLPPAQAGFAGRIEEIRQLDKLLQADATVVATIVGAAGIGKTTLAFRWAHQVADRFPDGQLFVNLRGFDPTGAAMSPTQAIRGLLEALQVPPERVPASFEAQVGLYRTLLAQRRMLLVLDNARDAAQVRPLLPGAPGSLVLVTSRDRLGGLVATEGAIPLSLDPLAPAEAADLLARRLGADRVGAEPAALSEIVRGCAGLPLALAIAAARTASRPGIKLAAVARELRHAGAGLDAFAGGDPATDLRAVLSSSYEALQPDAARLFRLLALHPGPDVAVPAAASLAGLAVDRARRLLSTLASAHLLVETAHGRYAFHDLVRAYAGELAEAEERDAAWRRTIDHYVHTAHAAAGLLEPDRDRYDLAEPAPGVTIEPLADPGQALGWLTTERPVLVAAVERAADTGSDRHAWVLAWALAAFLDLRGHWEEQLRVQRIALAAATRVDDRRPQIRALNSLARAQARFGRYEAARDLLHRAAELAAQLADPVLEARVHHNLGSTLTAWHRPREALPSFERALARYRAAGSEGGQARTLCSLSWSLVLAGEHAAGLAQAEQALAAAEQTGVPLRVAAAWDTLGFAHHHLGQYERAADCYRRALELARETGDLHRECGALARLGDNHHGLGDLDAARLAWRQAITIMDNLGHPDADKVSARLADPTTATSVPIVG